MGKGTNTTTQNTTTAPNPQAMQDYLNVLGQAQGVAQTPYTPYGGELVAQFNAEQNTGVGGINQYANSAQPAIGSALTQAQASSAPLSQAAIQQYESPYTQSVVNATQAQFNDANAQQQQGVVGNAVAQGALGGNRSAVAQAETAKAQQLAQAPVIAGLENTGYNNAVTTAEQQQGLGLQGASTIGNLGVAGQTAGLTGAGAQLGAGAQQQATQQALDTANYGQFQNQQAYPYQQLQWLAGLDTGVGSQMGGTSSGTTTAPAPSLLGQIMGGVAGGAGILGSTGAFGTASAPGWLSGAVSSAGSGLSSLGSSALAALGLFSRGGVAEVDETLRRASGGAVRLGVVPGYADGGWTSGVGGVPYALAKGYIPTNSIHSGSGAPPQHAPAAYQVPQNPLAKQASDIGNLAKTIQQGVNGQTVPGAEGPTSIGGPNGPAPLVGVAPYGGAAYQNSTGGFNGMSDAAQDVLQDSGGLARGGVAGFDDGGVVSAPSDPYPGGIEQTPYDQYNADKIAAIKNMQSYYSKNDPTGQSAAVDRVDALNNYANIPPNPLVRPSAMSNWGSFSPAMRTKLNNAADGYSTRASGGTANFDDGGVPTADDSTVINPDQPFRLDPEKMEDWRQGVDHKDDLPDTAPLDGPSTDPIVAKARGVAPQHALAFSGDANSNLPSEVSSGYSNGIAPSDTRLQNEYSTSGYPSTPSTSAPSNGVDWSGNGKIWPSLISAGASMLASRSPFLGNAIGEGLGSGAATYAAEQKAERDAQQHADQLALERERLERPYKEMTANEKAANERALVTQRATQINQPVIIGPNGKPMVNPDYIKAKEESEKSFKPIFGQIDELPSGQKVWGWQDPNTKQLFDTQGKPYQPRNPAFGVSPPSAITPPSALAVTPTATPSSNAPVKPAPKTIEEAAATETPVAPPPSEPVIPPHPADPKAAPGSEASRDTAFLARIEAQEPGYASAIKKAANYELDPTKYYSMRNDKREKFLQNVLAYDRNFNPQEVGLRYKAQAAYLPGTENGKTITAFNTAISHLDLLKEMYKELKNGPSQTLNKLKNAFQTEFGYAAPNDVNALASIIGGEVVKATVGSQNALGDREEVRHSISRDLSTMQADSVIDKYQGLMAGQLDARKYAYEHGTGLKNFDEKFLMPRTREVFGHVARVESMNAKPTFGEFMSKAKVANPNKSESEIKAYYDKTYGGK
jgi:hypothetical protein